MKKHSLILAAALALTAISAKAQYIVDPTLPKTEATEATDVTDEGYTANWIPYVWEQLKDTKILGYYVCTNVNRTAQTDGERFYLINTDFSYLAGSGGTIDDPVTSVTIQNWFVRGTINEPHRPSTWITANQAYAGDVLCLDGKLNNTYCNAQLMLNIADLSKGGGDVHFKFKVRSDGESNAKTLGVYLRLADTESTDDVIDKYMIKDLGSEWREVEFTLHGGTEKSDILFKGEDDGDFYKMFYYIDDLQVWQELKAGETAKVLYKDGFLMDDTDAGSMAVSTVKPYDGEYYSYTVSGYDLNSISQPSNEVTVGTSTAIGSIAADGAEAADSHITVYSLDGTLVASGAAATLSQLPKGVYVVKQGTRTMKVAR